MSQEARNIICTTHTYYAGETQDRQRFILNVFDLQPLEPLPILRGRLKTFFKVLMRAYSTPIRSILPHQMGQLQEWSTPFCGRLVQFCSFSLSLCDINEFFTGRAHPSSRKTQ